MLTNTLSLDSIVCQRKGNVVSDMNGSKVMLSIEQGKYYNLGKSGGDIWDMMIAPIKVGDVIMRLKMIYEVEEDTCSKQVLSFISQLIKEDLVSLNVL